MTHEHPHPLASQFTLVTESTDITILGITQKTYRARWDHDGHTVHCATGKSAEAARRQLKLVLR